MAEDIDAALVPRAYQLEMLEQSLDRNIIVAMDTGSGKTQIAILRIRAEVERSVGKIVWFLCPTVALSEQQGKVIQQQLPSCLVRTLTGNQGVESWSDQQTWDDALLNVGEGKDADDDTELVQERARAYNEMRLKRKADEADQAGV